ncbi:ATP-grasp domain-containing protein [Hymenobacter cheonanensis]|uniref:ATP-grasp domain-containing protein n=1 Tax=Hymenobacter sp. CA2-7 TaxID=3063993 RepID=UPI00271341A6|nr:ATP-grasp domain-containing protein [Hymenobacter sp. CA2-7]MDO7884862.1 ATP-grasp domain-containing protein [Hymenobacter sp. CA2-7]
MHLVYPCLPYRPRTIDPLWEPEYEWARAQGLATGLVDLEENKAWVPALAAAAQPQVVYRGWMLTGAEYRQLGQLLPLAVPPAEYLASHQATGWYDAVAAYTFPSRFLHKPTELDFAGGREYFVKGLVKSFGADSIVSTQEQLAGFWARQDLPAGTPLFVRDFVALKPASERRFFVVRGHAYGANGAALPLSLQAAVVALRPRLFYSLDVAETLAGQPVLVEVGDGQVSDLKEWSVAEFGHRVLRALATAQPAS